MRKKILRAAFDLMSKKSVKDVSMREISEVCHITKPSLYYYFKDKDEICYTMIKSVMEKQNNYLQNLVESGKSLKDILINIFERACKNHGKKALFFFLHVADYIIPNIEMKKKILPLKKLNDKRVEDIFLKEVENKKISLKQAKIGYYMVQSCLRYSIFLSNEDSDCKSCDKEEYLTPKDMALAVLNAINYKYI